MYVKSVVQIRRILLFGSRNKFTKFYKRIGLVVSFRGEARLFAKTAAKFDKKENVKIAEECKYEISIMENVLLLHLNYKKIASAGIETGVCVGLKVQFRRKSY